MRCSLSVWSEVQIVCMWSGWCHCIPKPQLLLPCKSRLLLLFWYWLTQVVLERRPLNRCSSSSFMPDALCFQPVHAWLCMCMPAEAYSDWLAIEFSASGIHICWTYSTIIYLPTAQSNFARRSFCFSLFNTAFYCVMLCCRSVQQASIVSKRLDESSWLLAQRLLTLCYKEIWVLPEIRVLSSGTLSQTLDSENFSTASR